MSPGLVALINQFRLRLQPMLLVVPVRPAFIQISEIGLAGYVLGGRKIRFVLVQHPGFRGSQSPTGFFILVLVVAFVFHIASIVEAAPARYGVLAHLILFGLKRQGYTPSLEPSVPATICL